MDQQQIKAIFTIDCYHIHTSVSNHIACLYLFCEIRQAFESDVKLVSYFAKQISPSPLIIKNWIIYMLTALLHGM